MNKISKDTHRRKLVSKLEIKRLKYKYILYQPSLAMTYKLNIQDKLIKLPRDSSKVRIRNRCVITGRPRGVYKDFRLSRLMFRELALEGRLPGIKKASW
jgi:ribosomal protein S14